MQLGDILKEDMGVPVVGRNVEFHLLRDGEGGKQRKVRVKAKLCFVSEPTRRQALRLAHDVLKRENADAPIPETTRKIEESICFLAQALRDADDPAVYFVGQAIDQFRTGLIPAVVDYLIDEYVAHLRDEYPECITPEERKRLEAEAAKNSKADQH